VLEEMLKCLHIFFLKKNRCVIKQFFPRVTFKSQGTRICRVLITSNNKEQKRKRLPGGPNEEIGSREIAAYIIRPGLRKCVCELLVPPLGPPGQKEGPCQDKEPGTTHPTASRRLTWKQQDNPPSHLT
jgi:hypothetical protein